MFEVHKPLSAGQASKITATELLYKGAKRLDK